MLLKNAYVLDENFEFQKADIQITEDRITKVGILSTAEDSIDLDGKYVIPGLIDIHTHGAVGTDTMDIDFDFSRWQEYLFSYGVTTFLPSTVSQSYDRIVSTLQKLAKDPRVVGINLEGPYLERSKRGAHDENMIRPGDFSEMKKLDTISNHKIKITTVAPEIPGNIEFISYVTQQLNIKAAAGHSAASYDEAMRGFKAGITNITHTFNAMNSLNHREPGLLGAALTFDGVTCEVISDGVHLHPAIVRLLYKILGKERMVLISDSMAATGLDDGNYNLGGLDIIVKDGVAKTTYGAIAGSTKNLMQMTRKAVEFGIPMNEAVQMASLNAAKVVGLDGDYGSIQAGKLADLIVIDENLQVLYTIKSGMIVYQNA